MLGAVETLEVLRPLVDGLPFPAGIAAPSGEILHLNAKVGDCFGELLATARNLDEWFERAYPDPAYRAEVSARWEASLDHEAGIIHEGVYRLACADGSYKWVEAFGTLFADCATVIFRDVTRTREARLLAETQATFLDAVVANAGDGICVMRIDGGTITDDVQFSVWNRRMAEITGYTRDEVNALGWATTLFATPDEAEVSRERASRLLAGETLAPSQLTITRKDGQRRDVTVTTTKFIDAEGTLHLLGLGQDVTERNRAMERRVELETQVAQARSLESLGVLAGGIAHDFNNLLAVIVGYAELGLDAAGPTSAVGSSLRQILTASDRARGLTTQMLAYVGKSGVSAAAVDLNGIVQDHATLEDARSADLDIELRLESSLPACWGDATQMTQVVGALINNAAEAMAERTGEGRKRLRIETRRVDIRANMPDVRPEYGRRHPILGRRLLPGTYVSLAVFDDGVGIDDATLRRIFEPFFSTKFQGRGLSLAAVLGILRSHEGEIFVSSRPGRGSCFEIFVPTREAVDRAPTQLHLDVHGAAPSEERGVALVVDDEDMVRQVAGRMLEQAGFTVLEATDGLAALEVVDRLNDPPDVVLLDLTMPRLDGFETFRRLRKRHPAAPVVLMSGYARGTLSTQLDTGGHDTVFLQKPFRLGELREAVHTVLEGAEVDTGTDPSSRD